MMETVTGVSETADADATSSSGISSVFLLLPPVDRPRPARLEIPHPPRQQPLHKLKRLLKQPEDRAGCLVLRPDQPLRLLQQLHSRG